MHHHTDSDHGCGCNMVEAFINEYQLLDMKKLFRKRQVIRDQKNRIKRLEDEINNKAIDIYHLIERPDSEEAARIKILYKMTSQLEAELYRGEGKQKITGIYEKTIQHSK